MKAILNEKYGPPEGLELKEIAKPTPQDDEVLIKVHAASVNPLDWHIMRASPFFVRFEMGWLKPKNPRLGADIAGEVEAVGKNVAQFQPGDAVFGDASDHGLGSFAEYACASQETLALKPSNLSFEAAAAVPVAGLTALQALRDKGKLQAGQKVLINGASGGVGTFAVQLAKHFGAEVTGVCSTRNVDMVRSIGADHVIDYTQEDFSKTGQTYDLLLDNVANRSGSAYRRALSPTGICVLVGFSSIGHMLQVVALGAWLAKTSEQTIGPMLAKANEADLVFLKELLEAGKVVPVIDRQYPLSETAEAIGYLETGRARGKVVITLG